MNMLKVALYEHEKKYLKAINCCNKLITIINSNKIIFEKSRIGIILANLSLFKTFIGKYKEAVIYAQRAQQYCIPNSISDIAIKAEEFRAHFYMGEHEYAERNINAILKHSISSIGEFRYATYVYYQCCNLFALKKYVDAATILSKPLEIKKDKSHWNISVRILKVMLLIELDEIDKASMAVESLRKYMERIPKNEEVEPRIILIVKLLRELEKNNFIFDSQNSSAIKLLEMLSAKNKPTSWRHYTPELIKFHEWAKRSKVRDHLL